MKQIEKTLIFVRTDLLLNKDSSKLLKERLSKLTIDVPRFTSIDGFTDESLLVTLPDESIINSSIFEDPEPIATFTFAKLQTGYMLTTFQDIILSELVELIEAN